jgi:hypothetical protein
MKKKLISIQRFWVYSLFHLQIVSSYPVLTLLAWSLVFKYPHRKNGEDSSHVSMQAKKLELHIHNQSSVQDNFWTATNALHNCNVVEHHCVGTTYEDMY